MKKELIEIRSEEVQEILGYIPNWIIRWGITVILITISILIIGSCFFKYPDIITSSIVVTTENPPASIVSRSNGKIQKMFVKDNQQVKKDDYVAIIENPANYEHIFSLKIQLDSFKLINNNTNSINLINFHNNYTLGELQTTYSSFLKKYFDYQHFIKLNYHNKKINSIKEQIKKYNILYSRENEQKNILAEELELNKRQYYRDSTLFKNNVISESDIENSETILLQKKYSYEGAKTSLANTKISISQLEQSIIDLELQFENQKKEQQLTINEAYENLVSQIKIWEQNYVLKSPINGKVAFTKFWSINQNVKTGDNVMTIVSNETTKIIGKLELPIKGSGKVKIGQNVNIKLDNYPHMEYGMVRGVIKSISLVTNDNNYSVEVSLPDGLITNYDKTLKFTQQMQGTAEIITEDILLIERVFNPIKSLLKNHQ